MNNFNLHDFTYEIENEDSVNDTALSFNYSENGLTLSIKAEKSKPKYVRLKWSFKTEGKPYVCGDAWETSYGNLCADEFKKHAEFLPWYFAAQTDGETFCLGVKTGCNSFVCFSYDESGVTAHIDCRSGSHGVRLGGRTLELCTFVFRRYPLPIFDALCKYCKELCDSPLLPKGKIYGGNNWYYAYGESSREEILSDARLQAKLSEGIKNPPFMVIDDGWQLLDTRGPYIPNEKYGDMKSIADEFKSLGVRPGIWIRFLENESEEVTDDMKVFRNGERKFLDPTDERVQALIVNDIKKIKSWGFELIKHDFSTHDLFGSYGSDLTFGITNAEDWHFKDETKTNAEIALDFYRLIRKACGDMLIIGCNTISHLCAGLVQINRTGGDTSGRHWEPTRDNGVNTLAFRLCQNGNFYLVDADCVGILGDNIPWEKNRQWLDILSKSDTMLFTSCASLDGEKFADVRRAYFEIQKEHKIKPLDIYSNRTPYKWEINGELTEYKW